jgi:hypothetical protein
LPLIRVGSGTFATSGYTGTSSFWEHNISSSIVLRTDGVYLSNVTAAASVIRGSCVITNITGNTWVFSGQGAFTNVAISTACASTIALAGVIDRVRITTVNGTDTFDAGTINILYE